MLALAAWVDDHSFADPGQSFQHGVDAEGLASACQIALQQRGKQQSQQAVEKHGLGSSAAESL